MGVSNKAQAVTICMAVREPPGIWVSFVIYKLSRSGRMRTLRKEPKKLLVFQIKTEDSKPPVVPIMPLVFDRAFIFYPYLRLHSAHSALSE